MGSLPATAWTALVVSLGDPGADHTLTASGNGSSGPGSDPAPGPVPTGRLDRYRLGEVLGRGGQGTVFLADQPSVGRQVAVKILHPGQDPALLLAEARLTARIDHPNVITIHDAGADFLVMERIHGESLAEWLRRHGPGPLTGDALAAAMAVLITVADTVAAAHARGVCHRDLKPGNIMVGDHGAVLVLDWGLAAPLDARGRARLDPEGVCAGTPAYLPPEVAVGDPERIGAASDVFLLGGILYRCLAGRAPFAAAGSASAALRASAEGSLDPAPAALAGPPRLIALAVRALDPDPAKRGDAAAFAADLRAWRHNAGLEAESAAAAARCRAILADPVADWRTLATARPLAQRAARAGGADADLPAAVAAAEARRAIDRDDLGLATALAARLPAEDPRRTAIDRRIAAHRDLAAARERRARRQRRAASALTAATVALAALWAWDAAGAGARAESIRLRDAAALVAEADAVTEPGLGGLARRQALLAAAAGLAPSPELDARLAALRRELAAAARDAGDERWSRHLGEAGP
jgi:hypothetical protein